MPAHPRRTKEAHDRPPARPARELLAGYDAETAALENSRRELFERVARREGLSAEWRAVRHPLAESIVVHARYADLAVAARPVHPGSHGPEPGADMARHLARHDVCVEACTVASGGENVGSVLLSRAMAFRADLLVMGAYGHSRLTELVFGGATRMVLREGVLPVLMSR